MNASEDAVVRDVASYLAAGVLRLLIQRATTPHVRKGARHARLTLSAPARSLAVDSESHSERTWSCGAN